MTTPNDDGQPLFNPAALARIARGGRDIPADLTAQVRKAMGSHVQQIVETAYGRATGDLSPDGQVDLEDLSSPDDYQGDGLLEFILRETSPDGLEENSAEHIEQAISRMRQVVRETLAVLEALEAVS